MKLCLKLVMLFAVIALMSSCKDAQSATAVDSVENMLKEIKQTGKSEYKVKISASPRIKIIYFYPYTNFENTMLEDSAKEELKLKAFSIEKPLFAVIDNGKVLKYCDAPYALNPSGTMPMIWQVHNCRSFCSFVRLAGRQSRFRPRSSEVCKNPVSDSGNRFYCRRLVPLLEIGKVKR